ncbi:hypothetical protein ACRRTK_009974 [Alexandromys fortis]
MCLPRVRDEEPAQVYPEGTRRHHTSDVSARQSLDKRIHYMQNLRKEKRKLGKRFARPAPVPDPGIIRAHPPKPLEHKDEHDQNTEKVQDLAQQVIRVPNIAVIIGSKESDKECPVLTVIQL